MKKIIVLNFIILLFITTGCHLIEPTQLDHYTGSVEGKAIAIKSKVTGEIISKNIDDGSLVKKGDILYELDSNDLIYELNQLTIEKEIATLTYSDLKNGVNENQLTTALNQLNLIEQEIKGAQLDYDFLLTKYENNKKLYEENALPKDKLDSSKYNLNQSKNKISLLGKKKNQALSSYRELETATSVETLKKAKKQIDLINVRIEKIKDKIKDYSIIAPIDGRFKKTYYDEGELISQFSTFGNLVNSNDIWLNIYIPEKLLNKITIGQRLKLTDDFISKDAYGEVIYISDTAEFTPKNVESKESKQSMVFKIKIKLHNTKKVKPGMFLTVDFSSDIHE